MIPKAGDRVRAEVLGWAEAQANNALDEPDPAIPTLEDVPQFVEGPLVVSPVYLPGEGISYTRYNVAGYDVDPTTIKPTARD